MAAGFSSIVALSGGVITDESLFVSRDRLGFLLPLGDMAFAARVLLSTSSCP
jgi:hypothetical protein